MLIEILFNPVMILTIITGAIQLAAKIVARK